MKINKKNVSTVSAAAVGVTTAIIGSSFFVSHADASTLHTVKEGEYLSLIANKYNVSIGDIREWNDLTTDVLQIGQELIISSPKTNISTLSINTTDSYTSTATSLRVRADASTNSKILGSVSKGQVLNVISYANGWYKINYQNTTGYVSGNYVQKITNSSTNTAANNTATLKTTQDTTSSSDTYEVQASSLNVRSSGSTNSSVIGSVKLNEKITVLSITNGWAKIKYKNSTGYVSSKYIKSAEQSSTVSINSTQNNTVNLKQTDTSKYVVTTNSLNVRAGASTSTNKIGKLTYGQNVEVLSLANNWYKVNYNGTTGYVSADYIKKVTSNSSTVETKTETFNTNKFINLSMQYVDVPYVWGGTTPDGFDCSGFIYYLLNNSGIKIGRANTATYWNNNSYFTHVSEPQPGDLLFLQGTYTSGPSHIGIYLGNNQYISAIGKKIQVQSTVSNYTKSHFLGYKRINSN